jgi:hypothetical protein
VGCLALFFGARQTYRRKQVVAAYWAGSAEGMHPEPYGHLNSDLGEANARTTDP